MNPLNPAETIEKETPRPFRPEAVADGPGMAYGAACPECGGNLTIREGDWSVRCGYCGSALLVTAPRGVQSYILEAKVTPAKARLAAIHHLAEKTNRRVGARDASIVDLRLIHVPFWRMRGRLMGWVTGRKTKLVKVETTSDDPAVGQTRTTVREEREPFARLVFKRVDWSTPACVLPCLGLQGISLRTGFLDWSVLDDRKRAERTVALPTRSAAQTRRDATAYLARLAAPAGATIRARRSHLFDSAFSLYYYPVYLLRYGYRGRIYTITIDGGNGAVVRGDVPRRGRIDAKRTAFVPAALAFLAATWLPLVLIPLVAAYALDTAQAGALLPPHRWLALRIHGLLGGED